MKTKVNLLTLWLAVATSLFTGGHSGNAQTPSPAARPTQAGPDTKSQQSDSKPHIIRETDKDGTLHRITGKARILDAHTIAFEDGTEVDLNGVMDAPELEQKAMVGDSFYPCGQEAAEFLKKLIGDRPVTFLSFGGKNRRPRGNCYAGETFLQEAMVRNGWAVSDHSATELAELIARENKRGLWRGKFITPKSWRKGERMPGESLTN
jgi:endonuclease YncB( thermonuclease family)